MKKKKILFFGSIDIELIIFVYPVVRHSNVLFKLRCFFFHLFISFFEETTRFSYFNVCRFNIHVRNQSNLFTSGIAIENSKREQDIFSQSIATPCIHSWDDQPKCVIVRIYWGLVSRYTYIDDVIYAHTHAHKYVCIAYIKRNSNASNVWLCVFDKSVGRNVVESIIKISIRKWAFLFVVKAEQTIFFRFAKRWIWVECAKCLHVPWVVSVFFLSKSNVLRAFFSTISSIRLYTIRTHMIYAQFWKHFPMAKQRQRVVCVCDDKMSNKYGFSENIVHIL